MEIRQFFLKRDIKGAIEFMRSHEEYKEILPAYVALFEDCQYRTYEVSEFLNDILRQYQVYYRDMFYCGMPECTTWSCPGGLRNIQSTFSKASYSEAGWII